MNFTSSQKTAKSAIKNNFLEKHLIKTISIGILVIMFILILISIIYWKKQQENIQVQPNINSNKQQENIQVQPKINSNKEDNKKTKSFDFTEKDVQEQKKKEFGITDLIIKIIKEGSDESKKENLDKLIDYLADDFGLFTTTDIYRIYLYTILPLGKIHLLNNLSIYGLIGDPYFSETLFKLVPAFKEGIIKGMSAQQIIDISSVCFLTATQIPFIPGTIVNEVLTKNPDLRAYIIPNLNGSQLEKINLKETEIFNFLTQRQKEDLPEKIKQEIKSRQLNLIHDAIDVDREIKGTRTYI